VDYQTQVCSKFDYKAIQHLIRAKEWVGKTYPQQWTSLYSWIFKELPVFPLIKVPLKNHAFFPPWE
jgi:hypothetical protein